MLSACSAELRRPADGPCRHVDVQSWRQRAEEALTFPLFQPGPGYDVDAAQGAVPVRLRPIVPGSRAVLSWPDPERFSGAGDNFLRMRGRSFVYDNALAILWALERGDRTLATDLMQTLDALQNSDGSWGFSFAIAGDGFYNASYVRAGTVAWAVYAAARYGQVVGGGQFDLMVDRGLGWLIAQVDPQTGLVLAGRGRWIDNAHFDPAWIAPFAAMEHQIDAWFALQAAASSPERASRLGLRAVAGRLADGVDRNLWRDEEGRYAQGELGGRQDADSALDASGTWAALWDLARGRPGRARKALAWVDRVHSATVLDWPGYKPYAPGSPDTWFVEGGLARALAWHRLGEPELAAEALAPAAELACEGGVPLVYSPRWFVDFPLAPAAAPTLWFSLIGRELTGRTPWLWTELGH